MFGDILGFEEINMAKLELLNDFLLKILDLLQIAYKRVTLNSTSGISTVTDRIKRRWI